MVAANITAENVKTTDIQMPNTMSTLQPALMWFRDDLRLRDNSALDWIAQQGPVIAVVIEEDPETTRTRELGAAARWWWQRSVHQPRCSRGPAAISLRRSARDHSRNC